MYNIQPLKHLPCVTTNMNGCWSMQCFFRRRGAQFHIF